MLSAWSMSLSLISVCWFTASDVVCEEPTPPNGVTVVQPHNTKVSSVIVYQCQQSGFAPSPPSSVCGEDGTWSPNPSQVVCSMIPTTTLPSSSPAGTVEEYLPESLSSTCRSLSLEHGPSWQFCRYTWFGCNVEAYHGVFCVWETFMIYHLPANV